MNTKTQPVEQLPANTAPIQNLLRDRIRREPEFTGLMLEEVVECLLKNDVITAQLILRDITNCKNLFQIIYSLQHLNKVRLEIRAV